VKPGHAREFAESYDFKTVDGYLYI